MKIGATLDSDGSYWVGYYDYNISHTKMIFRKMRGGKIIHDYLIRPIPGEKFKRVMYKMGLMRFTGYVKKGFLSQEIIHGMEWIEDSIT